MFEKFDSRSFDWTSVLPRFGISAEYLQYKEGPCPICSGTSRFRYKGKDNGDWFCNHCRGGDGLDLIAKVNNWTIAQTIKQLNGNMFPKIDHGTVVLFKPVAKDPVKLQADLQTKWANGVHMQGTPVETYLKRRVPGFDVAWAGANIRYAELWYKDDDGVLRGKHPCMLSRVVDLDGIPISLHRTYLTRDGYKAAQLGNVKKLMKGTRTLNGDAIRLNRPAELRDTLIVAEGVETGYALVASTQNRIETWSLLNAGNLAKCQVPRRFKKVIIAADRDPMDVSNGFRPGEHFAAKLAARLKSEGFETIVKVPTHEGQDFCDLWKQKHRQLLAA